MENFISIKKFLISWGLAPYNEHGPELSDVGNSDGERIMNRPCFYKMIEEATLVFGTKYSEFIDRYIEAVHGNYFLNTAYWKELEISFNEKFKSN